MAYEHLRLDKETPTTDRHRRQNKKPAFRPEIRERSAAHYFADSALRARSPQTRTLVDLTTASC